jgi:uncharacterized membrane protein YtjA (UPF0391 family)
MLAAMIPVIGTTVMGAGGFAGMDFLWWAVVFFVLAIIAGLLGFGNVAGLSASAAKWLVILFIILALIALIL